MCYILKIPEITHDILSLITFQLVNLKVIIQMIQLKKKLEFLNN